MAKPQAIVDFRGGEDAEPADGWPKEKFLTPELDGDISTDPYQTNPTVCVDRIADPCVLDHASCNDEVGRR